MPYQSSGSFMGLAPEATRGTAVAPSVWLPVKSPQVTPQVSWLKDESLRGSPVETYGNVAGIRHDEYECKGDAYLDTFPNLVRATLGSTDTVTTAPASTTLSSLAAAGATSIQTAATVAAGSFIIVGSGTSSAETHRVTAVSGSGPYTLTLAFPLVNAQAAAAAVVGLTGHQLGLLNNPAVGSQPPSYTVTDFDGVLARQLAYGMADSLSIDFASDASLSWSTKFLAMPYQNVATPTGESFSTELFVPGYSCTVAIGGVVSKVVVSGSIALARSTSAITTANNGQQVPYSLFAGPLGATGKFTFVVENGDNTMTLGTTSTKEVVDLIFTNPQNGDQMVIQMSQVQLTEPKINRGKAYVEVDASFIAESNATDALSAGYSPVQVLVGNHQTASY